MQQVNLHIVSNDPYGYLIDRMHKTLDSDSTFDHHNLIEAAELLNRVEVHNSSSNCVIAQILPQEDDFTIDYHFNKGEPWELVVDKKTGLILGWIGGYYNGYHHAHNAFNNNHYYACQYDCLNLYEKEDIGLIGPLNWQKIGIYETNFGRPDNSKPYRTICTDTWRNFFVCGSNYGTELCFHLPIRELLYADGRFDGVISIKRYEKEWEYMKVFFDVEKTTNWSRNHHLKKYEIHVNDKLEFTNLELLNESKWYESRG